MGAKAGCPINHPGFVDPSIWQSDFIKIDVEGYEYEVIKGLTYPVRSMSFEFTPEYLDATLASLEHLRSIGHID